MIFYDITQTFLSQTWPPHQGTFYQQLAVPRQLLAVKFCTKKMHEGIDTGRGSYVAALQR